ncbi:MAG: hypothetical protein Q8Q33_07845 [Chlamydiota bacterium]|nr:hypothetical protein [Chlamydiota bacterium]
MKNCIQASAFYQAAEKDHFLRCTRFAPLCDAQYDVRLRSRLHVS